MFEQNFHFQSRSNEGEIFNSLINTALSIPFSNCDVLMAYASLKGCYLLNEGLNKRYKNWSKVNKKWLISIDNGITEPKALEFLMNLENSEVRIPNAAEILGRNLRARNLFHHKLYLFDAPAEDSLAIYTGSPNLTVSGLYRNNEQATSIVCYPEYSFEEQLNYLSISETREIFTGLFDQADILTGELFDEYKAKAKRPKFKREDDTNFARKISTNTEIIQPIQALTLATSDNLWVEIRTEISNSHIGNKGSQLDLQRGTRTFFGFSGEPVEKNKILGSVKLKYKNRSYNGTFKFGNNSMDKLNLPPCNDSDLPTYVNQTLLFRRRADGVFEITIGNNKQKKEWKNLSDKQGTSYQMKGGRRFGIFR